MATYYTYDSNLRDRNKFTSTVNTTYGHRRYFSSLDTEVYFGSQQIDEIVAIDFTISEPKLPIYGFNSFYANRIVSGRRTIQGTFAINFTHTLDLLKVLESIDDSVLKSAFPTANGQTLDYEALTYRCEGEDSTGLGIGNSAIFTKMFDITISYGYGKTEGAQTFNSCYQTLVGVQIVDYRQALDTEGNPILDMYSFIAKDLRYQEAVSSETSTPSTGTTPTPGNTESTKKEVCSKCNKTLAECDCKDDKNFVVANKQIQKDMAKLNEQCTNSSVSGFIVDPIFNYTEAGHYAASAYPYLYLSIDSVNNNTEKFTDVIVTINNESISIPLKDIKKGGFVLHEFKDSTRDLGITLRKNYMENDNYKATCDIEFIATVEGENIKVEIFKTPINRNPN